MKSWVTRILKVIRPDYVSEESWGQEIHIPVFAWKRLSGLMQTNWVDERFTEIFGSCLAQLSEDDFLYLLRMKNLYLILPERLGEVHGFSKGSNSAVVICIFSPDILLLPDIKIRGIIAHELGHIFEDHYALSEWRPQSEIEGEANQRAINLGFSDEIEAIRQKKQKGGN